MTEFSLRTLDPDKPYKPLDFGNGRITGSVAPHGRFVALNTYHPEHGYVTLSAHAPFPDAKRFDQSAVRAYRASLADPLTPGFGFASAQPWTRTAAGLLEDTIPHTQLAYGALNARVTTWAPYGMDGRSPIAVQVWQLENISDQILEQSFSWEGYLNLTRSAMTQLTEGGIIPLPPSEIVVIYDGEAILIYNPAMATAVAIMGLPSGSPFHRTGTTVPVKITEHLEFQPGEVKNIAFIFAFGATPEEAQERAERVASLDLTVEYKKVCQSAQKRWQRINQSVPSQVRLVIRRASTYALDCCTLPLNGTICILTDHQILPLSWTRDAYYIAGTLMTQRVDDHLELIWRHLTWLFKRAQRTDGYWGRAYLPNGQPKDHAFQLDQQCYPLLELADFFQISRDETTLHRLAPNIPSVLEAIFNRKANHAYLFATEETPADDPLTLPYHFSSQVLVWHTFRELAELNDQYSFTSHDLESLAEAIHADIWRHFAAENEGQHMFAYAVDTDGNRLFYHDANDLPTVLAPVWGFCRASDPVWRATMDFAFSPRNQNGYYTGAIGGLGSLHTPGAWPLGDVQEWIYAQLVGDQARAEAVIHRLASTACWDGSLPEARDPNSGEPISRHWFAWPNCALLYAINLPDLLPHL